MLPKANFCGVDISRLIVGGNMVSGVSHVNPQMDQEMEDYFTTQRVKDMLFQCQEAGINTFQFRGDKHIYRIMREFRLEGGNMNWIAQSAPEHRVYETNVEQMANYKPVLMFHHGVVTDDLFKAGEYAELERRLGVIRKTGIPTGLCTHMPEVVEYAEAHKWDLDFYMCSAYNLSVPERLEKWHSTGNEDHIFIDSDVPLMYEAIRCTDKPCLVFKILGSSRRCQSQETVAHAFKECFASIKNNDAVVVGMYPKDMDQVTANVKHVKEALGE